MLPALPRPRTAARTVICVSAALLAAALACPSGAQDSLESLWRTGQFDKLRSEISSRFGAGERSPGFLAQAARGAEEMHSYTDAAMLFGAYADAVGTDSPDAYREAKYKQWKDLATSGKSQDAWLPE
jgi:hypothetical protein